MSTLLTRRRSRIVSSLGAGAALVLSTLVLAAPASAAGVELDVDDATITEGESITLSWTSTDAVTLVASGDWSGDKTIPAGSEDITPSGPGTYTYTLTATDAEQGTASDTVTVTVDEADPEDIVPDPVTFPGECTIVVPDAENVTYYIAYEGGFTDVVDPGTYQAFELAGPGEEMTFFVEANDGFTLAEDAVTEWDFTASEDCFGAELVEVTATCGELTFENVVDSTVYVLYGNPEGEGDPDDEFELEAGESRTVETSRDEVAYVALSEDLEIGLQIDFIDVPQNCGDGDDDDHPTVAPAAGLGS